MYSCPGQAHTEQVCVFVCLFTVLSQAAAPCVETAGQERRTETEVEMFPSNKIIHNLNGSFIFGGSYLFKRPLQARQTIKKSYFYLLVNILAKRQHLHTDH